MWVLLHFTRLITILKKAADRPIGHVASAVMLNAKLKKGVSLMHVIAMTRALGQLQSPKDTQPEIFSWTDASQSTVTCTFVGGKLSDWQLSRPAATSDDNGTGTGTGTGHRRRHQRGQPRHNLSSPQRPYLKFHAATSPF